jgi:hypothetical protein
MTRDPIGEAAGTNLYQYASGNPLSEVDFFGLQPEFTEDSALTVLAKERNRWRSLGWNFAANLLSWFISRRGPSPYYGTNDDNASIKNDPVYRGELNHNLKLEAFTLKVNKCKNGAKSAEKRLRVGANWDTNDVFFNIEYITGLPWGNAFYALGSAHFGVDGRLIVECCDGSWSFTGEVYQKDVYTFPPTFPRTWSPVYRAAVFLEQQLGYKLFEVRQKWHDSTSGADLLKDMDTTI